jgi:hypothetical protein
MGGHEKVKKRVCMTARWLEDPNPALFDPRGGWLSMNAYARAGLPFIRHQRCRSTILGVTAGPSPGWRRNEGGSSEDRTAPPGKTSSPSSRWASALAAAWFESVVLA